MKMYETDEEYRSFFLHFFQVEEYDQEKIAKEMDRLYEILILYEPFNRLLKKLVSTYMNFDEEEMEERNRKDVFIYLFSYDHLFDLYQCVQDVKEHNEIRQEYLDNMLK